MHFWNAHMAKAFISYFVVFYNVFNMKCNGFPPGPVNTQCWQHDKSDLPLLCSVWCRVNSNYLTSWQLISNSPLDSEPILRRVHWILKLWLAELDATEYVNKQKNYTVWSITLMPVMMTDISCRAQTNLYCYIAETLITKSIQKLLFVV